jgi:hypothetical protein
MCSSIDIAAINIDIVVISILMIFTMKKKLGAQGIRRMPFEFVSNG